VSQNPPIVHGDPSAYSQNGPGPLPEPLPPEKPHATPPQHCPRSGLHWLVEGTQHWPRGHVKLQLRPGPLLPQVPFWQVCVLLQQALIAPAGGQGEKVALQTQLVP
jgi:hypothetical protein